MFLSFGLSDVVSWLGLVYVFWQECHRIDAVSLRQMYLSGGVNFDHIAKMVSAKFLHFKGIIFPFVINNYFVRGDTDYADILFLIMLLPNKFNIYQKVFAAAISTLVFAYWRFYFSLFFLHLLIRILL